MSYATRLIEHLLKEYYEDNYTAFLSLLETEPLWFPKKAVIDKDRTNKKCIYCVLDEYDPMTDSSLQSFKTKIKEEALKFFDTVTIADNDDGFSILIG